MLTKLGLHQSAAAFLKEAFKVSACKAEYSHTINCKANALGLYYQEATRPLCMVLFYVCHVLTRFHNSEN